MKRAFLPSRAPDVMTEMEPILQASGNQNAAFAAQTGSISWKLRLMCFLSQTYAVVLIIALPVVGVIMSYIDSNVVFIPFWANCCIAVYYVWNLFGNWLILKKQSSFVPGCVLASAYDVSLPGCHFCSVCQKQIWQRDHHCLFLGSCVGKANLSNFIAFCWHATLGSMYASFVILQYNRLTFKEFWSSDCVYYLMPLTFAQWISGQAQFHHVVGVVILNVAVTTSLGVAHMLLFHLYIGSLSQTTREFCNGVGRLSRPSLRRLRRLFGNVWPSGLLAPRVRSFDQVDFALQYVKTV